MCKFLNKNSLTVQKSAGNIIQTPIKVQKFCNIFLYGVKKKVKFPL